MSETTNPHAPKPARSTTNPETPEEIREMESKLRNIGKHTRVRWLPHADTYDLQIYYLPPSPREKRADRIQQVIAEALGETSHILRRPIPSDGSSKEIGYRTNEGIVRVECLASLDQIRALSEKFSELGLGR